MDADLSESDAPSGTFFSLLTYRSGHLAPHNDPPQPPPLLAVRLMHRRKPRAWRAPSRPAPPPAVIHPCRISSSDCRNSSAARGFFWQPCRHAV
ncbi:protein of unknown function [Burkholderia multivorans]